MKKTITDLANEYRNNQQKIAEAKDKEIEAEANRLKNKVLELFEKRFNEYLPLLKEEKITWTSCMYNDRYPHEGSYVLFQKEGYKSLIMDFEPNGTYRYCSKKSSEMVFARWDTDRFPLFIQEGLLDKKIQIREED